MWLCHLLTFATLGSSKCGTASDDDEAPCSCLSSSCVSAWPSRTGVRAYCCTNLSIIVILLNVIGDWMVLAREQEAMTTKDRILSWKKKKKSRCNCSSLKWLSADRIVALLLWIEKRERLFASLHYRYTPFLHVEDTGNRLEDGNRTRTERRRRD